MTDKEIRLAVLTLAVGTNIPGSIINQAQTKLDLAKEWYGWIAEGNNRPGKVSRPKLKAA